MREKAFTRIILISAVLLLPLVSSADHNSNIVFTVQGLYDDCRAADGTGEALMCTAYISGVMDLMSAVSVPDKGQLRNHTQLRLGLCPESSATFGAGVQVFKNWAAKNPQYWGWNRGAGVVVALREVWPCT